MLLVWHHAPVDHVRARDSVLRVAQGQREREYLCLFSLMRVSLSIYIYTHAS